MDIAVIGAGAAGMMAAYSAAKNGAKATIYERNEKAGKKIYITGKGRCNVCNASDVEGVLNNIVTNRKFMYSSIYAFTNEDVMKFFEDNGLRLKVERGNRVFPESDHSQDVINTLKKVLRDNGVKMIFDKTVTGILAEDIAEDNKEENGIKHSLNSSFDNIIKKNISKKVIGILLENGEKKYYDKVIFATGGISYPVTGSDGMGIRILEKEGHRIVAMRPALVPMNCADECVKDLQGLSLKNVKVLFYEAGKKKPIFEDFGEMLFTHFGVSGPVILSASSFIGKKIKDANIELVIDLKPALSENQLDDRILRDFDESKNKDFRNSLDKLLPKSLIPVIIDRCKIDPYKKVNEISKSERIELLNAVKKFRLHISSLRGFNEAIITSGGINVKDINPATMESKIIKNLYIAGEMIDVDALTGGYNLQVAWSTGWLAGISAASENLQ